MSDNADVVVVGGGVIGLSCAWRLAQRGRRVVVRERHVCGSGASGAALGALMPAPATRTGPFQRLQRQSLGEFPEFVRELRERTGIDPGYRRDGLLEVLHSAERRRQAERECAAACAEWPATGAAAPVMALLSDAEAQARAPGVALEGFGARYCRATAHVDVTRLIAALRAACAQAGVDVRERAAVERVMIEGGRVRGAACAGDVVAGDTVLVAAGVWSGTLGTALAECAAVAPVKGQAMLLSAPHVGLAQVIKRRGIYLIPCEAGEVMVGATTEPEGGDNTRPTASGIAELTAGALALIPALAEATVVRTWAGLRPKALRGDPVMGAVPGVRGLYVAAGHYKTGIGLSALVGRLVAEMIATGEAPADLSAFSPVRAG